MEEADDDQVARRPKQPDYTKKDFKRAADDLLACLHEALEFFPQLEAEFSRDVKDVKKYGDEELLNLIWEKKIQKHENAPRARDGGRNDQIHGQGGRQDRQPDTMRNASSDNQSRSSSTSPSIDALKQKIQHAVEAMFECKFPEPIEDSRGIQIRVEEVRDFENRMQKTADRMYNSLLNISHNVRAFRTVIRDLTAMSQDLKLFHLDLWKADVDKDGSERSNTTFVEADSAEGTY